METLFPLLVAVLEVFNWYGLQHVCYEKNKCFNLLDRIVNEQDLFSRVITGSHRVFNKILRPIGNVRRGTLWALLDYRKLKWVNRRSNQCWFFLQGKSSFFLNFKMSSTDIISGLYKISKRVYQTCWRPYRLKIFSAASKSGNNVSIGV